MFSKRHEKLFRDLPSKIKINSVVFDISVIESDSKMLPTGPLGMLDIDSCQITVRLTGNISQDINTVVHEVMHGIFYQQDIRRSPADENEKGEEDYEEPMVIGMANGFLSVFYDNEKFADWLSRAREEVIHELC